MALQGDQLTGPFRDGIGAEARRPFLHRPLDIDHLVHSVSRRVRHGLRRLPAGPRGRPATRLSDWDAVDSIDWPPGVLPAIAGT